MLTRQYAYTDKIKNKANRRKKETVKTIINRQFLKIKGKMNDDDSFAIAPQNRQHMLLRIRKNEKHEDKCVKHRKLRCDK